MPLMSLESIRLRGNRIRKEFDPRAITSLANVIMEDGLLHALTVDEEGFLLAGERRLRAVQMLAKQGVSFRWAQKVVPPGEVPVEIFHSTAEILLLRAELRENTERMDLTWKEKVAATDRLLSLQGITRELEGLPPQTQREAARTVAEEIESAKAEGAPVNPHSISHRTRIISRDALLAAWLDDPEVAAAGSEKDAYRVVEKKLLEAQRKQLSQEFKALGQEASRHALIHGDALVELEKLPKNFFDVIITDPPYGVNIDKYADVQGGVDHHYDDSPEVLEQLLFVFAAEFDRVTKPEAHLYLFCDFTWFEKIAAVLGASGIWAIWPRPIIWHRSDSSGMLPRAEHGPRRNYECVLYALRGDKRVNFVANDVIPIPSERGSQTAARKPVELYVELLRRSVLPGNRVLDPCCGSGPVFEAAERLECVATGIEINEALVGVCSQRLMGLGKG